MLRTLFPAVAIFITLFLAPPSAQALHGVPSELPVTPPNPGNASVSISLNLSEVDERANGSIPDSIAVSVQDGEVRVEVEASNESAPAVEPGREGTVVQPPEDPTPISAISASSPLPPPAAAVAASLQMGTGVAVAVYVHHDVRWRDFAPLAGLFTRIRREKLLEHPVRELIYTEIRSNPGIHYRELLRKLGIPNGSLAFHLHHLERAGYVRSRRARGRRHLFTTDLQRSPDSFLVTDRQGRILEFLQSRPGASERLIVKALGMSRSNVSYHIGVLRSLRLVETRRVGGRTLCYVRVR